MTDIEDSLEIDVHEAALRAKPISQYEVLQLVQPLREAVQDLLVSYMDVASELVRSSEGEKRDAFMVAFEKIGPCFEGIGEFDLKVQRLLNGLDINDSSIDVSLEDDIDE